MTKDLTMKDVMEFSEKQEIKRTVARLVNGDTVPVTNDSVEKILEALLEYLIIRSCLVNGKKYTVSAQEILRLSTQFTKETQYHYLNLAHHAGIDMLMLTLVMTTSEDEDRNINILDKNGVFGYVYNFDGPDCSELGYSYYKQVGTQIRRIG